MPRIDLDLVTAGMGIRDLRRLRDGVLRKKGSVERALEELCKTEEALTCLIADKSRAKPKPAKAVESGAPTPSAATIAAGEIVDDDPFGANYVEEPFNVGEDEPRESPEPAGGPEAVTSGPVGTGEAGDSDGDADGEPAAAVAAKAPARKSFAQKQKEKSRAALKKASGGAAWKKNVR